MQDVAAKCNHGVDQAVEQHLRQLRAASACQAAGGVDGTVAPDGAGLVLHSNLRESNTS
jgi:hypothetical protein